MDKNNLTNSNINYYRSKLTNHMYPKSFDLEEFILKNTKIKKTLLEDINIPMVNEAVINKCNLYKVPLDNIEKILDILEEVLLEYKYIEFARELIRLRIEERLKNEQSKYTNKYSEEVEEGKSIYVTKRNGEKEKYDANKINKALEIACVGLTDPIAKVMQIASETELSLYDGITTEELDQAIINVALQNIKEDPEYDVIATRLLLKTQYKKVLGDYHSQRELIHLHKTKFKEFIDRGIKDGLLDRRMRKLFDLELLAQAIDVSRDSLFKYIGLHTLMNRYMLRFRGSEEACEVPQYFWMRVAMGFSLNESNPTYIALKIYDKISRLEYLPAGSSLIHAGTPIPRLSNCFIAEMHDSIDHIGKSISDVMKLTKATGGIGLGVTKLRAEGSPIKGTNTFSSGPIPFMHIVDSAIRAVSRAGKKLGALCFYMENWHLDFPAFLDLKQNSGDEYRRTRTANTAVFISDEFMKRVINNQDWYLFDPQEVPELTELYGQEFSKKYNEYVQKAEKGEMRIFKKIKAREQFKAILLSLQTTAHPWLTFKDTINVRALNNNTGTIHLSNLCTEITLPQDKDNVAVCNLASINIVKHLDENADIDWNKLEETVRIAIRHLDNLVDITVSPIPEADNANKNNRAVGLGIMGFTEAIEKKAIAYDSEEAYDFIDHIMEFISYIAIDQSCELARERGVYPNFEGSMWSKGYVPFDTIDLLETDRGMELSINKRRRLNWDLLREKVKRGIRNATLLAIAPTASIGLVAGTTTGIDPRFAQIFSRATSRGKFLELNENLVRDLKKLGLWEQLKDDLIKNHGDIELFDQIPSKLKKIYKTSFKISPLAFIEVASRAQKWVDQAISRNMYLATRDIDEVMHIYIEAWRKALKTTYYLHMKPRHTAEQSTVKVNKALNIGKKGFGFGKIKNTNAQLKNNDKLSKSKVFSSKDNVLNTCPVDPQERLQCESCQ